MQNRLVLTGIPSSLSRLPDARDGLRELVEDRACWVDRFAFLASSETEDSGSDASTDGGSHRGGASPDCASPSICAAGVELHIENVRDKAIESLDGLVVSMDRDGCVLGASRDHDLSDGCKGGDHGDHDHDGSITFRIRAHPANAAQSRELVAKCPVESDDAAAEGRMETQTLRLPLCPLAADINNSNGIELSVRRSEEHGGTGTFPWRGGFILARQICHWWDAKEVDCKVSFRDLFSGRKVLELGAGAAGLPSMTLGKIIIEFGCEMELVASDGVDDIVSALKVNVSDNGLDGKIEVRHVDWNDYASVEGVEGGVTNDESKVDTILFADCIYNEECATSLSRTISHFLKQGGMVVGVLPDFRVGVGSFERRMKANGFGSTDVPIVAVEYPEEGGFACSGGGGKDYRLVLWERN